MENYIQQGQYYFINQVGDTVRSGRAPHYTIPYWLARQFAGKAVAGDFLSVVNIALDSTAIVCLGIMAFVLSAFPRIAFFTILVAGAISTYVSNLTFITVPDGAAAALFMMGTFYYWKAYSFNKNAVRNIFLASFFFSWAVMLRPYLIVILVLFALIYLIRKRPAITILHKLAVAGIFPLLLFMLPWVARNYNVTHRVIPFQQDVYAGYGYYPTEIQVRKLITAMGEDGGTFWDPTAMASYYSPVVYKTSKYQYPPYLLKDSVFVHDLEKIRMEHIETFSRRTDSEENNVVIKAAALRSRYINNHPFRYYLSNPLRRTIKFWGHSGSYYISLEGENNLFLWANKLLQSLLYFLVLIAGTIGLLIVGKRNEFCWILLLPLIILTLMFPVIFGFMEPRYAIAFYYPSLLGLLLLCEYVVIKFHRKRMGLPVIST
ncbi:MAG: hypothetical protein ABIT05_16920 [Chitinophagaceae bacterium]